MIFKKKIPIIDDFKFVKKFVLFKIYIRKKERTYVFLDHVYVLYRYLKPLEKDFHTIYLNEGWYRKCVYYGDISKEQFKAYKAMFDSNAIEDIKLAIGTLENLAISDMKQYRV